MSTRVKAAASINILRKRHGAVWLALHFSCNVRCCNQWTKEQTLAHWVVSTFFLKATPKRFPQSGRSSLQPLISLDHSSVVFHVMVHCFFDSLRIFPLNTLLIRLNATFIQGMLKVFSHIPAAINRVNTACTAIAYCVIPRLNWYPEIRRVLIEKTYWTSSVECEKISRRLINKSSHTIFNQVA